MLPMKKNSQYLVVNCSKFHNTFAKKFFRVFVRQYSLPYKIRQCVTSHRYCPNRTSDSIDPLATALYHPYREAIGIEGTPIMRRNRTNLCDERTKPRTCSSECAKCGWDVISRCALHSDEAKRFANLSETLSKINYRFFPAQWRCMHRQLYIRATLC